MVFNSSVKHQLSLFLKTLFQNNYQFYHVNINNKECINQILTYNINPHIFIY